MDFGMPTLIEANSIDECVLLCKSLGLSFIEINMNLPEYQPDQLDIEKLNFLRKLHNIYFTMHLDENLNPCDFNKLISDAHIQTTLNAIAITKQIACPTINMHMSKGVYFTLPDRKEFLYNTYNDHYYNNLINFREQCEKAIGNANIKICIENTNGYETFSKKGIKLLLESKVFGLTLDTGHNYCMNEVDEPFILEHRDRINHMHLHDAIGKSDHLPIGQGEIKLEKYLKLANSCDCSVVLETKTINGLKESAVKLQDFSLVKCIL